MSTCQLQKRFTWHCIIQHVRNIIVVQSIDIIHHIIVGILTLIPTVHTQKTHRTIELSAVMLEEINPKETEVRLWCT